MTIGERAGFDLLRRVEDLTSGQFIDLSADAPTFDAPWQVEDGQLAFLDAVERRLYFTDSEMRGETSVEAPEMKRLSQRGHGERCLVTTGNADPSGRRIFWLGRVER